jgi:pilus assembly protein CpaF
MTTVHANGPRDALRRVENMVSMAGLNFPISAIRQQTSAALQLLVHVDRTTGGARKIMNIAEVVGMESDVISLHDLFIFVQTGIDEEGRSEGHFECCGVLPRLLNRLKGEGVNLPDGLFRRRKLS